MKVYHFLLICLLTLCNCFDLYTNAMDSDEDASLLVFAATDLDGNYNIYVYDGKNPARLLSENQPAWNNANRFCSYNGDLFFCANDESGIGYELWQYNFKNDTFTPHDLNPGSGSSYPDFLTVYNGTLYMKCKNNNSIEGLLYYFNNTNDHGKVFENNPGEGESESAAQLLTVYNGVLYYKGYNDAENHIKLCSYDGTVFNNQVDNTDYTNILEIAECNNRLYYTGYDGSGNYSLNEYDGSSATLIETFTYKPAQLTAYNGELYFSLKIDNNVAELHVYDREQTTSRVSDVDGISTSVNENRFMVYKNKLYFASVYDDGPTVAGNELCVYDGTDVHLLMDINPGSSNSAPKWLTVFKDKLYFQAQPGDAASDNIYVYDGTGDPQVVPGTEDLDHITYLYVWERKEKAY